jgi:dihydrofolate reductase
MTSDRPLVVADISTSLDGFVTGPHPSISEGLGRGGEALHEWAFSDDPVDAAVLQEGTERSGAVIMGRRLFDIVDGPDGWNEDVGYGAGHAASPPFVVVTHHPPDEVRLDLDITFVTEGVEAAIEHARAAVRPGGEVVVMGGGDVIGQCLAAGLVDELRIHLAPIVLGGGTPLFPPGLRLPFVQHEVRPSSTSTHITYRRADPS